MHSTKVKIRETQQAKFCDN